MAIEKPARPMRPATPAVSVVPHIRHQPRWRMAPHAHAGAEVDLVADGDCELSVPGNPPLRLHTGDAFAIPPRLPHGFAAGDQGCAFHVVHVEGLPESVLQRLTPADRPVRYPLSAAGGRAFVELVGTIERELALGGELAAELAVALSVQLAALVIREGRLAAARRAPSGAPAEAGDAGRAHVSRALALISEGSIVGADVAELAARLHLSPSHLRRLFRRYLGVSPKAYLEQRRLDRARGLLLQTDLPITTIAAQLGFARPQHFTAAFTVAEGVPPTRWRQQQRLPGDPGTPGADDARDATRGP